VQERDKKATSRQVGNKETSRQETDKKGRIKRCKKYTRRQETDKKARNKQEGEKQTRRQ